MQVKDPTHVADSKHSSHDHLQGRALEVQSILPHSLFTMTLSVKFQRWA
jgi:hypothetical protein